ncbi:MAG: T9SS type A sorting domain-containing protein [candidate division SR1 bacterium]|nr:T9SS type A sorting domain-containing protein [candidate division SR1 bacterium]
MKKLFILLVFFFAVHQFASAQLSLTPVDTVQVFIGQMARMAEAIDDLDGDGILEIVAFGGYDNQNWLTVTKHFSNGTDDTTMYPVPNRELYSCAISDANSDGVKDIAYCWADSLTIMWGPTFSTSTTYYAGHACFSMTSADVNLDGKSDFICLNWSWGAADTLQTVTVFTQTTGGFIRTWYPAPLPVWTRRQVRCFDFNQDGWPDIALLAGVDPNFPGTPTPGVGIYILMNDHTGSFTPSLYFPIDASNDSIAPVNFCFGNFFGTGPGLLVSSFSTYGGTNYAKFIRYQSGTWSSIPVQNMPSYLGQSALSVDLDLDGKSEAVYISFLSTNLVLVDFTSPTSNTIVLPYGINSSNASDQQLVGVNIVGDTKPDVVLLSNWGRVIIFENKSLTGVDEFELNHTFSLYPNPTNDFITVLSDFGLSTAVVYDAFGRIVLCKIYNETPTILDVSSLAPGIYVCVINDKQYKKFIKK